MNNNISFDSKTGTNETTLADLNLDLYQEYVELVRNLKQQGLRRDVAMMMRLTVVMLDLGIYQPSAP